MKNSQKENLLHSHRNNNVGTVYDAYKKPSRSKIIAWENILDKAQELKSVTMPKVNSFNTYNYSVSFEYVQDGKRRLKYYTSRNTYDFEI